MELSSHPEVLVVTKGAVARGLDSGGPTGARGRPSPLDAILAGRFQPDPAISSDFDPPPALGLEIRPLTAMGSGGGEAQAQGFGDSRALAAFGGIPGLCSLPFLARGNQVQQFVPVIGHVTEPMPGPHDAPKLEEEHATTARRQ